MKTELRTRLESLAWRAGMMALAAVIDYLTIQLTSYNLPAEMVVMLGLILGELSKAIYNEITICKELDQI